MILKEVSITMKSRVFKQNHFYSFGINNDLFIVISNFESFWSWIIDSFLIKMKSRDLIIILKYRVKYKFRFENLINMKFMLN